MTEGFLGGFPEGLLDGFPDRAPIVTLQELEYVDVRISRIETAIIHNTKLTQTVHTRSDYVQPLGRSKAYGMK